MLFGYLNVRVLLVLVRAFGRMPDVVSRVFALLLNSATRPFDEVNYLGSRVGTMVFLGRRKAEKLDRTITSLHRHLDSKPEAALRRGMHFPRDWNPFFKDTMSLAGVYHYATQHFEFHRHQLTLTEPD